MDSRQRRSHDAPVAERRQAGAGDGRHEARGRQRRSGKPAPTATIARRFGSAHGLSVARGASSLSRRQKRAIQILLVFASGAIWLDGKTEYALFRQDFSGRIVFWLLVVLVCNVCFNGKSLDVFDRGARMFYRVLGAALGFLAAGSADAQPDSFCRTFSSIMETDELYVATCASGLGCLKKVVTVDGRSFLQGADGSAHDNLHRGRRYHFIYRVPSEAAPNSLVVAQIMRTDVTANDRRGQPDVRLRRYRFAFACYKGRSNVELPAYPPHDVRGAAVPHVSYKGYDEFHRYGFTDADEDHELRDHFHVRYYNGEACVSTLDPVRRSQFLIDDRQNVPGFLAALAYRLGFSIEAANAQTSDGARRYDRINVVVTNYQKEPNSAGCFGFTGFSGRRTATLDIRTSELEKAASNPLFDRSRSWSFDLK